MLETNPDGKWLSYFKTVLSNSWFYRQTNTQSILKNVTTKLESDS